MQDIVQSRDYEAAFLLALQRFESGAWLQVISLHNIGILMDTILYTTTKTHIALRIGSNISQQNRSPCNAIVNEICHHGLHILRGKAFHKVIWSL